MKSYIANALVSVVLCLTLTGIVWAQDAKKDDKAKPVDPCVVEAQKGDKAKLEAALAKCTADAEAAKKATAPKPAPK